MKNLSSESGFTLVELLVIVGVIAVLSVGFASYLYQQTKQGSMNKKRQDYVQLQDQLLKSSGSANNLIDSQNLQK